MKIGEFTPDDIVDYLNQELPGFEPQLQRDSHTQMTVLRVRARLAFAGYADIPDDHLFVPVPNWELKRTIEDFIRKTRRDMIEKLGLQKQIDDEVQTALHRERAVLERKAYEKATQDILANFAKSQAETQARLAAGLWNTFMGRDVPTPNEHGTPTPTNDFDDLDFDDLDF
jgi:hypothetical protein